MYTYIDPCIYVYTGSTTSSARYAFYTHNPIVTSDTEKIQNTSFKKLFQNNIFMKMTIADNRETTVDRAH